MRHLGRAYYVGLLSAAEIHGAAHTRNVPSGRVTVATREHTAADLVAHPRLAAEP